VPNISINSRILVWILLAACTALVGCASVGPKKMPRDRTQYNNSITESWKQQLLLNIVKIRYVEPLFFVDVGDIVSSYSLETGGNIGFSRSMFDLSAVGDSSSLDLGLSGRYTDRPTVTYRPLTGQTFLRGIMAPIPVRNVILGIDSGVSAKFLIRLGVRRINGLQNQALLPGTELPAQSDFQRVVEIMSLLQIRNALHISNRPQAHAKRRLVLTLGKNHVGPETGILIEQLQDLLDLDPCLEEYALVSGSMAAGKDTISLQTYSLMQILASVAAYVDIPEKDVSSGRAIPGTRKTNKRAVHSSSVRPEQAFASVKYRGRWFWIDDHDLETKRVFSFILLAFTLLEDDRHPSSLQLTVPTQ
jgi:hypothetical protein